MFCTNCGATIGEGQAFCPACGAPARAAESAAGGQAGPPPQDFVAPADAKAKVGEWIGAGWRLVQPDLVMIGLMALVMMVVAGAVPLILQGPMMVGMHIVFIQRLMGKKADFNDLFQGFHFFVPSLVATLLISVFVGVGLFLCIVPGLIVAAIYQFTYLFIADRKMDFWPAMQASHALVKKDYFGFTLLLLAFAGLHILGTLACFIGLLVTIPIQYAALTVAYKELVGLTPQSNS